MAEKTSLQQKLEQYSTTVKGQTTHSLTAAEIAGYAAAAGAALTLAGTADASIIYSGVQNISVQINPNAVATGNPFLSLQSTSIDIDGGGADIRAVVGLLASSTQATYGGFGVVRPASGSGALLLQGTGTTRIIGAANLPVSNYVGTSGNFGTGAGGFVHRVSVGGTNPGGMIGVFGNFALGVTGIAGFQLASGNYGWIRLRIDDLKLNQPFKSLGPPFPLTDGQDFPDKVTIIDWAYDDSGAPIHVADTTSPVPEPSSLVLLASGAAGIAAFRRRKAERRV